MKTLKAGISQGGLGSDYVAIVFKNLNNVPCTLYGYPGISLAGGKPVTQIGAAATENPPTPGTVPPPAPFHPPGTAKARACCPRLHRPPRAYSPLTRHGLSGGPFGS